MKTVRNASCAIGAAVFCICACFADSAGCGTLAIATAGVAIMTIGILIEERYCFEDDM